MGVKWKEEDSLALEHVLFEELDLNNALTIEGRLAFFKDFMKYLQHNRSEEIKGRTPESLRNNIRTFKDFCFELGFTLMDVIHILRMSPSILNVSIESLRDKYALMGLIDDHSYHLRKTKLILCPDDYRVSNELIYARYMLMKTLDYPIINWSNMVHASEKEFAKIFVKKDGGYNKPYKIFSSTDDLTRDNLLRMFPYDREFVSSLRSKEVNEKSNRDSGPIKL
ncbi:MAG: hypothetical protein DBY43_05785 [Clostridiaceae bacterium]|nr:MAG: hypothetical protein DBY43_05785 [Clostridiaceae bacterium]